MAEALVTSTGTTITHDETAGLQNSVATPLVPGDANDDDVLFSSIPAAFSSRLGALTTATPIGAAESDGNVVTFAPTGTLGNIALTDANGAPLDGDDSGLVTTGGEAILLYTDTNDNIVLGKTAGGTLVFAIYLEETARRQYLARSIGNPYVLTDAEVESIGTNLRRPNLLKKVWDYHHAKLRR